MRSPLFRKAFIVLTSAVAIAYLLYRGIFTLNLTTTYATFASVFLYVGEIYGVVNMLLYFVQVWDVVEPPFRPPAPDQTVDVFVPTYNEDTDLLRLTLKACVGMDYPHKTYLCDDGGTEARCKDPEKGPGARERQAKLKAICEELGVIYCTRPKNEHAKAGNLNYAFERTDGEYLIIFDADHVPEPHFITRLLGYFEDPNLAFVQTPHAFYNFDSFQARLNHGRRKYWEEGQLFYHVIQPGRNRTGCPIFAGSAALFRRSALKEVGYIAMETITEDMHTGMRMHSKGWKSLGIAERMVAGQAAQDVTTFHSQRLRWGEGNISVIFYDNPLTMKGLSLGQRLCYMATILNWAGGLFKLAIYLTPLLMLFTGVPPVARFTWGLAMFMTIYMALSILGTKVAGNGYGSFWYSELFTMAGFWTQIRGTMRAIFWRKFQQFVVTAKRGRQSKSIWPYIRPQVYLIVFSAMALLWAWSRVALGVSDDPFKPMLASFWACFHILLAYLVIRRAHWPDDRRYATRHTVYVPVVYKSEEQGIRGLGFTSDLNDQGMSLIAYEPLAEGEQVRLTVQAPAGPIEVIGLIKHVRLLTAGKPGPSGTGGGFRHGVQFITPPEQTRDALNLLCLHYAVPRLYKYYAEGHRPVWLAVPMWLARHFYYRRASERREYRLPLYLFPRGAPEMAQYAVTEDVSRIAMALLVPAGIEAGTEVRYTAATPLGELSGTGRVRRCEPVDVASRPYHRLVVDFDHIDEEGRVLIADLMSPAGRKQYGKLLHPTKAPLPVPVSKPLAQGLAALLCIMMLEYGVFRVSYRDDFFLRTVAVAERPLEPEERDRVDRIYHETMESRWPGTDRLVLLSRAMTRMDRPAELAELTRRLAPRDPNNLDLRLALAFAHDQREDYAAADAEFRRLLQAVDAGQMPESRRDEIMAGAARAAAHAGDPDLAGDYFRPLVARHPDATEYRDEYASALLGARRYAEAVTVLSAGGLDHDGRVLLVIALSGSGDWRAAEREARAMADARPDDPAAQALLADVFNAKGDFKQAQAIYEKMLRAGGNDPKVAVQLANASLWSKNYDDAAGRFQAVLDSHPDPGSVLRQFPQIKKGFVNAAASATEWKEAYSRTAVRLFDDAQADRPTDAIYLARLGWVLQRAGEMNRSATVLDQAFALNPTDPGIRRQLAGVLVATDRAEDALRLLQENAPGVEGRLALGDAYAAVKNLDAAEREYRAVLDENPTHKDARLSLANVLSWKKEYAKALEQFDQLIREHPDDPELPVRVAEVTLWSGDGKGALARYQALLTADFDRPWLWYGFVDAAGAAKGLNTNQVGLVRAIAERTRTGDHASERVKKQFRDTHRPFQEGPFLTRLAWLLIDQTKDPDRATAVLDLAVKAPLRDPEKKELAGVLAAAGRYDEAIDQYKNLPLTSADHVKLARILAAAERFPPAIEHCREALKTAPLDREARATLADVLSYDGQHREALAILDTLIDTPPPDPELRRRRAEVTLWSGDAPAALKRFTELVQEDRDNARLWPGFIEAAERSDSLRPEQAELAKQLLTRPEMDESHDAGLLARGAWVLFKHLNEPDQARAMLGRATTSRPKDAAILTRLGWTLHRMGEKDTAATVLAEAVALQSKKAGVRKELAGVLTAIGRFKDAAGLYTDVLKEQPGDTDLETKLAQVTLWAGDAPAALERLGKLLAADFRRPVLWRAYVDAASAAPELTPAQVDLAKRIAVEPLTDGTADEQATFCSRLAWALHRAKAATADVNRLLDRALALKPADPKARGEIAGVLTASGRPALALPWLEELAAASPSNVELQRHYAEAALGAGEYGRAADTLTKLLVADFERPALWVSLVDAAAGAAKGVLKSDQVALLARLAAKPVPDAAPEKAVYLSRLAWALQREGMPEQAGPLLEQAVKSPPADPKMRRELAGLLTAAGRFADARAWLEELVKANPGDRDLQGKLAEVSLWGGDRAAALDGLTKVLEADFDRTQFWQSFVDAAAPANKGELTPDQVKLAARLAGQPVPKGVPEPSLYLSRLGWVLHREGRADLAGPLLAKAAADPPADPKARRELGGVLTAAGRVPEGLKLFEGITLTTDDRLQLVVLYAAAKQFDKAAEQADAVVRDRPTDRKARKWRADVSLWGNHAERALPLYTALLTTDTDDADLWPGFVEAAVKAGRITDAEATLVLKIADQPAAKQSADAVFLARLGLLLHRDAEGRDTAPRLAVAAIGSRSALPAAIAVIAARDGQVRGRTFIDRALAGRPKDPTVLARLAWTIHMAGYQEQAVTVLDEAIALKPVEPAVRREVGDVLVATGRLKPALKWFEEMTAADAKDAELQLRLAEVTVWAGEYAKGLSRLEPILRASFERPDLWRTFADAASSVDRMTDSQLELAGRIADRKPPAAWGISGRTLFYSRLAWAFQREADAGRGARSPSPPGSAGGEGSGVRGVTLAPKEGGSHSPRGSPPSPRPSPPEAGGEGASGALASRFGLHPPEGLAARARKLLDLALAEKPTDPAVRLELAGVLTAARRLGAALAIYESLALERPGDPDLLAAIAKLTLWDGRPEPALDKLESLLSANFQRRDLWQWFAAAAADVKRLTRPQLDLLVRLAGEPTDGIPDVPMYRARLAVTLHREATALNDEALLGRADALLDQVVANPPADPSARRDLAGLLAAAGKPKVALELVRGLDTSDAAGHLLMADLYAAAQDMPAAEKEARELVKLRPDWDSRFKLADVLGWNHKYGEARELYAALAKEHDDPRLPLRLAQMALWSGSHDEALVQYARLVERGDRQDVVIAGYIDAASGSKKLDPAAYRKSALVVAQALHGPEADDPAVLSRLAYTMSRLKEPNRAVELLTRALELDPDSRPIRQQLAEALTDAGRYAEAEKHYRALLRRKRGR